MSGARAAARVGGSSESATADRSSWRLERRDEPRPQGSQQHPGGYRGRLRSHHSRAEGRRWEAPRPPRPGSSLPRARSAPCCRPGWAGRPRARPGLRQYSEPGTRTGPRPETSGNQQPRLCISACRATFRSRARWRRRPRAVPPDHAAIGLHQHDPVHAQLGQLLHRPLGPVAFDRGEGNRQQGAGRPGRTTSPSGSSDPPPGAPRPFGTGTGASRPGPVGRPDRFAWPQPQDRRRDGGLSSPEIQGRRRQWSATTDVGRATDGTGPPSTPPPT